MSDLSPPVSVCVPTYNYGALLPRTIESILGQTFEDFELIVVDDVSSDNTDEVVARYADDPRLTYIKNSVNRGLFANFNYCAEIARGKYLKFVCADDWLDPHFLERMVPILDDHPEVGLVTNSHTLTTADERPVTIEYAPFGGKTVVPRKEAVHQLIEWHYVIGRPTNVLLRRDAFLDVGGFDEDFAPPGDLHLWLKLLREHDLGAVREPLNFIRSHDTKTHKFGNDPTETVFEVWWAAASWPDDTVTETDLKRAIGREGIRCALSALDALLRRNPAEARRILKYTTRQISPLRLAITFAMQIPRIARNFITRTVAVRTGRYLLIEPTARLGPPINSAD